MVEFTATDPDPDNTQDSAITWSLVERMRATAIVGGTLTFAKSPNYEAPVDADKNNVYKVTVGFADADGNRGEQEVEVKVGNVDEEWDGDLLGGPAACWNPDGELHRY